MPVWSRAAVAVLAMVSMVGLAAAARAQQPTPLPNGPYMSKSSGPRIEVNPRRPLFRRCTSWYVIQDRPSGPVLFPQKHCWWVRG